VTKGKAVRETSNIFLAIKIHLMLVQAKNGSTGRKYLLPNKEGGQGASRKGKLYHFSQIDSRNEPISVPLADNSLFPYTKGMRILDWHSP
jgi:hypothetical protein